MKITETAEYQVMLAKLTVALRLMEEVNVYLTTVGTAEAWAEAFGPLVTRAVEAVVAGTAPPAPGPVYLSGPPPLEHHVTDSGGDIWERQPNGQFRWVATPDGSEPERDTVMSWPDLKDEYGPLTLNPPTPSELESERLYGPRGARWGNPDRPCPYVHIVTARSPYGMAYAGAPCTLGLGHIGVHVGSDGLPLGVTEETPGEARISGDVTPADRAEVCDCGHPEAHQEGCPRYARVSGGAIDRTLTRTTCVHCQRGDHASCFGTVPSGSLCRCYATNREPGQAPGDHTPAPGSPYTDKGGVLAHLYEAHGEVTP